MCLSVSIGVFFFLSFVYGILVGSRTLVVFNNLIFFDSLYEMMDVVCENARN